MPKWEAFGKRTLNVPKRTEITSSRKQNHGSRRSDHQHRAKTIAVASWPREAFAAAASTTAQEVKHYRFAHDQQIPSRLQRRVRSFFGTTQGVEQGDDARRAVSRARNWVRSRKSCNWSNPATLILLSFPRRTRRRSRRRPASCRCTSCFVRTITSSRPWQNEKVFEAIRDMIDETTAGHSRDRYRYPGLPSHVR